MNYATATDMLNMVGEKEMIQLTDRAGLGVVDDAVLQTALADASSEADSYLPVPPVVANRSLVRHVAAIARFYLYKDIATDEVRERYTDAIAWLRLAAAGKVNYGTTAIGTPVASKAVATPLVLPHEKRSINRLGGNQRGYIL